jgi:hypothetical protein
MVFVVRGGGFLRTLERFLFRVWGGRGCEEDVDCVERRERRERLCARVLERRSVARKEAVTSAEGGSPNMKNLINAPIRITIDSCPSRRPWVNESLHGGMSFELGKAEAERLTRIPPSQEGNVLQWTS